MINTTEDQQNGNIIAIGFSKRINSRFLSDITYRILLEFYREMSINFNRKKLRAII